MAAIDRRKTGQFRARVRRAGYPEQTQTFPTRRLAEQWAAAVERSMDDGTFIDNSEAARTTLGEALARYAREVTPGKRSHRQEARRIEALRAHPLAERTLLQLRGADLADYRDARLAGVPFDTLRELRAAGEDPLAQPDRRPVGANSVRLELAIIGHLYTIARTEWGMEGLPSPLKAIRKPSPPPGRDRRLAAGEEARLLRACKGPLRAAVILALETAMRRGELAGLAWAQVDLARRLVRLTLTKNGDERAVPLSPRAVEVLEALLAARRGEEAKVFGPTAAVAEWLTHAFGEAAKAAGCPGLRFHDLRHEATSRLFEHGLEASQVAAITGHKTLAMLARYTHLRAEDLVKKLEPKAAPVVATPPPRRVARGHALVNFRRRRSRGVDAKAGASA